MIHILKTFSTSGLRLITWLASLSGRGMQSSLVKSTEWLSEVNILAKESLRFLLSTRLWTCKTVRYVNFSKVSAQPHTIVKQICFPNGNALFLLLFSLFKNWMHNVGWGCAEILPKFHLTKLKLYNSCGSVSSNTSMCNCGLKMKWR